MTCQGLHNNEINKKLGEDWKKATIEEKKVYNAQSHADKLRYLQVSPKYTLVMRGLSDFAASIF